MGRHCVLEFDSIVYRGKVCLLDRTRDLLAIKRTIRGEGPITRETIKRGIFKGLIVVFDSGQIHHLRSVLNQAMILLRFRCVTINRFQARARCVIGLHPARQVSALHVITRRTSVTMTHRRFRRCVILCDINVLVLVSRRVTRPVLVPLGRLEVLARRFKYMGRWVIRVRDIDLATARAMIRMSVLRPHRAARQVLVHRVVIINVIT